MPCFNISWVGLFLVSVLFGEILNPFPLILKKCFLLQVSVLFFFGFFFFQMKYLPPSPFEGEGMWGLTLQ